MQQSNKIQEYLGIVEKVARVEQRRIPSHLVEYEELMSIGIIAIQALVKNKTAEQLEKYNDAYVATAIRWAIRNELRNRYKWYSLKHTKSVEVTDNSGVSSDDSGSVDVSPEKIREAVYETILSIEHIQDSSDNDSPFDFIKDSSALPDEKLEIAELGKSIREAIAKLPPKERTIVEYRFYRNLQIKDIATQVGLSSSRVTRIVQSSLNLVREYLKEKDQY